MKNHVIESVLVDHVELCRLKVVQIDQWLKNNVVTEAQRRAAMLRRESAMEIYTSAKAVLQAMWDAQYVQRSETIQRRIQLIRETGGDLHMKFQQQRQKHHENN